MRYGCVLLVVAGCGRLGFDAGATDAALADAIPDTAVVPCVGDVMVTGGSDAELRTAIQTVRDGGTICIADGMNVIVDTALAITNEVTIGGNAAVCGAGTDRVFDVTSNGTLHLRDLTVCHGRLTDANGAAVRVTGKGVLDADGVTFSDNAIHSVSTGLEGGAIRVQDDARLDVRRSRFVGNTVFVDNMTTGYGRGGAIAIVDTTANTRVSITDTTFANNEAPDVGGALFVAIDGAHLTLDRLLFTNNRSANGAAIDLNCSSTGTITISSSTFASNVTPGGAGAMIFVCSALELDVTYSSFSGNMGAIVDLGMATGHVRWAGSAISSFFRACMGNGTADPSDYNIVTAGDLICSFDGTHDIIGEPDFEPLADNGGPTQTLGLSASSFAVDRGGPTCPALDQRGSPRPSGAACDVGAFER